MSDFVEYSLRRPAWLVRAAGAAYLTCLGLMKQAMLDALKGAVKLSMPDYAPTDALAEIARDVRQPPGFAGETAEQIRDRLKKAFPIARGRGWRDKGLLAELARIGYPNATIETSLDDGTLEWWQFRVVLERPFPFDDQHLADGVWGDPGTWGDGGVWATDVPADHLTMLRAIVRKTKATHSRCVGLVFLCDPGDPLDVLTIDA